MPIHSAIEELINVIFFEQKKMLTFEHFPMVAVEIKSGIKSKASNDQHLYKIIVSGIYKVPDILIYIQKGFLKTLLLIVKKMQALVKNDCHLCEIEMCTESSCIKQRNYNIIEHPQTGEDQINQSEFQVTKNLKYKNNWYFQVYQRHQHMVSECRSVYEHLQKLKIFNPEDIFKYSLELFEISCHPNLSSSPTFEINGKKLLNVAESHAKQAITRNLHLKPIFGLSVAVNIFQQHGKNILKLTSIGLNIHGNNLTYDERKMYLFEFFIFGPYGEPLHASELNKEISDLVLWKKYGLTLTSTNFSNVSNPSLKPECYIIAQPNTVNVSSENYSHFVIYLIFEINYKADFGNINILGELHNNLGSVLHRNKVQIKESVECVTDKFLAHKLNANQKKLVEDNAINTISESIWNIVLRSTNEDFRDNCLLTLGATSVHELKMLVEKKLRKVKTKQISMTDNDNQNTSCSFDMLEQVCPNLDNIDSLFE